MNESPSQARQPSRKRRTVAVFLLGGVVVLSSAAAYRLVLRSSPDHRFQTGLMAFEAKDRKTVEAVATELKRKPEFSAEASLLQGMADYLANRLPQAIIALEPARSTQRTRLRAWRLTGLAYQRGGRAADAMKALNYAIEADPDDVESHRLLATILYDLGAMYPCLDHLDRIAELDPADPRPLRLKGLINKDYDFFQQAVEDYREAFRRGLTGETAEAVRLEFAECLIETRNYIEATEVLLKCAPSSNRDCLLGECAWAEGDASSARRLAEGVLEMDPANKQALLLITKIEVHEQNADEALRHGEALLRVAPHDPAALLFLSQVYRLAGDLEKASQMVERQRGATELLTKLRKLHEDALEDLTNAELRYQIGELSLEVGRPEMARIWFEACLTLDPLHSKAQAALAEMQAPEPR